MVIRAEDRVATIIKADESLIEVFAGLSPAFERLRHPAMRKVMARLVTVEQAARMAGMDASDLVAQLNAHVRATANSDAHADGESASGAAHDAVAPGSTPAADPSADEHVAAPGEPAELAAIAADRRIELDVREELRSGNEPFRAIMSALRERPANGALAVRAIFEPVPLYTVMRRQGLAHYTEELGPEDWRVWFYPDGMPSSCGHEGPGEPAAAPAGMFPPAGGEVAAAPAGEAGDDVVVLDVRGLEPPEPMMRTLAALEQLPAGGTLVQLNVRVPQFLLPMLEERGFTYEVREQDAELVRVFIRRRTA